MDGYGVCATISLVSNPERRIYVHVGTRKTGTSYLQKVIYTAPETVTAQGVDLPLRGRTPHLRVLQALGVVDDGELPADESAAFLGRFSRNLSGVTGRRALISHEDLAAAEPAQIRHLLNLLGDFEVHVLLTARDLARQIPSEWSQCVKTRMQATYEEFLEAVVARRGPDAALFWARQDVADIAARWGRSLSPEQLHIVTVPPSGSSPSLLPERFWTVMGVHPTAGDVSGGRNPSLGAQQAELLRRVNVALGDRLVDVRNEYRPVIKPLVRQVLNGQDGIPLRLPGHLMRWCRDVSIHTTEQLKDRGYDVVGDLSDLVPDASSAAPPDDKRNDLAIGDSEVSEAAVQALATLLHQQHEVLQRRATQSENTTRGTDEAGVGAESAGQQGSSRWKRAVASLRRDQNG